MLDIHFHYNESDATLSFAERELKRYLSLLCRSASQVQNVSIEVTMEVTGSIRGLTAPAVPFLDDQYRIEAAALRISLQGTNSRSVLLAAYRLLSEAGCFFPAPGAECELIPDIRPEDICVSLAEIASCRHRGVCIEGADSLENIISFIDWLPKIGCNSFFIQHKEPGEFLERWYGHRYNPLAEPEMPGEEELEHMFRQIDGAVAQRGLIHHRVGHGWTSEAVGFSKACASAEQSASPSIAPLLAMVKGKRDFWEGIPSNTNLCYSEPDAVKQLVDCAVGYAAGHPGIDYLHIWLADECNNICECPRCRETTLTGQYISLLNEIDARLTAIGSDTRIALLLYQELLWPPIRQRLCNPDRFTLMFAPISRTFERSYALHGQIPPIPPYRRNKITLPNTLEENLAFLNAWQKDYDIDSFVYDYPLGRAHYGDLGYVGISRLMAEDIAYLPKLGLNGYISCQELRASLPNALPNYIMGRLLWNSRLSQEVLTEEYFRAVYGTGWERVLSYLTRLSELSSPDYFNGIGSRTDPAKADALREAGHLAAAFAPTAGKRAGEESGVGKIFWSRLDYHARYCILLTRALTALASGEQEKAQTLWQDFMDMIRRAEPEFQTCLDVYRVLEVATKFTGFSLDVPRRKG